MQRVCLEQWSAIQHCFPRGNPMFDCAAIFQKCVTRSRDKENDREREKDREGQRERERERERENGKKY